MFGILSKPRALALVGLLASGLASGRLQHGRRFWPDVEKLGDKIERKAEQSKRY